MHKLAGKLFISCYIYPKLVFMRIILTLIVLVLISCNKKETFDFETITISSIKKTDFLGKSYYDAFELTPETYVETPNLFQIDAGFIFEEKKASVRIEIDYEKSTLTFVNLGEESNYFAKALSQLFEVEIQNPIMKDKVIFQFVDNNPKETNMLYADFKSYKLSSLKSDNNVEAMLLLSLPEGSIKLMEYEAGNNRENFVKYFTAD